jgi:hypothetical protein
MTKEEQTARKANMAYMKRIGLNPDLYSEYRIKYNTFKYNLEKRNGVSRLTLKQYMKLAKEAGIEPGQIGLRNGQYQLGRLGDTGEYKIGNVRFITKEQNMKELYDNGGLHRGIAKRMARRREIVGIEIRI